MALINCSECGKEVSDKAAACPTCGAPIVKSSMKDTVPKSPTKVKREGAKWESVGTLLVILGIIAPFTGNFQVGAFLFVVGLLVFIVGRFK